MLWLVLRRRWKENARFRDRALYLTGVARDCRTALSCVRDATGTQQPRR